MKVAVYGGGLAGCEAAWQLAKRNVEVTLFEMKKLKKSPAHNLDTLCELVCSNSLKSDATDTAGGLLKAEMSVFDSVVISSARETSVPAGQALAVDRQLFSERVTNRLLELPNLKIVNEIVTDINLCGFDAVIVATGPLTDEALIPSLGKIFGENFLYFFDAVAPVVTAESIDFDSAFAAARYDKGGADYLNCPFDREEYIEFREQLIKAEAVSIKEFENNVFEGCMPIEVLAARGADAMRFGPLKPVGLFDKRKNERPYAVLQLRKENVAGTLYNLVGFQTHLKFGEQKRVFSLIPALRGAEFVRYGVMHRNTYFDAPKFLDKTYRLKNSNENIYFSGQLTGVEGYVESAASGMTAALQCFLRLKKFAPADFTDETLIGSLSRHVSEDYGKYVPMNANFGILRPLDLAPRDKSERKCAYAKRALDKIKITAKYITEAEK